MILQSAISATALKHHWPTVSCLPSVLPVESPHDSKRYWRWYITVGIESFFFTLFIILFSTDKVQKTINTNLTILSAASLLECTLSALQACYSTLLYFELKWRAGNNATSFRPSWGMLCHTQAGSGIIKSWRYNSVECYPWAGVELLTWGRRNMWGCRYCCKPIHTDTHFFCWPFNSEIL
jgi:hypothetical protein